ncbi:hypothetical protein DM860_005309 [Cuscuta australis]|uniref:Lipase n=1 Tax=Cuscuta australis TaxID=267555 RepID=A0A328E3B3_9ASTE|nr:hypothetical protein DM860_005309 [Cuscuta australis]
MGYYRRRRRPASLSLAVFGSAIIMPLLLLMVGPKLGSSRAPSTIHPQPQPGICAIFVSIHNYECQEHQVTTDDGYILSVQRIPAGLNRNGGGAEGGAKQPVLLQHGVLVDGATWLLNGPEQSLAMILADTGLFDVWISNLRGTKYSRRHSNLDPNKKEYWNWTWDDLVVHDVPTVIDYVFKTTGQKIHYIGHSMGTLIALAFLSEGKLVDKVRSATLLSPIAYLSHMTTKIGVMAAKAFVGEIITSVFDMAEFDPKSAAVSKFLNDLSGADCSDLMSVFTGENCCLNASTVDLFKEHEPQPTSTKNMVHLAQTVRGGVIAKYDYGNKFFNIGHYGKPNPPVYNLTNIPCDFPIFMSYGGRDALSDSTDVLTLQDNLKSHDVPKLEVQYIEDYAHADFIMGITAKDVLYTQIVKFLTSLQ